MDKIAIEDRRQLTSILDANIVIFNDNDAVKYSEQLRNLHG